MSFSARKLIQDGIEPTTAVKGRHSAARCRGSVSAAALLAAIAGSCAWGGAVSAFAAQDAAEGRASGDEIVVSARRTGEESVQDVPMAITVVSPEELAKTGTVNFGDVLRQVPSVTFEQYAPGFNRITIRGLVNARLDVGLIQDRSLVAVYLDDIPMTVSGANPELRAVDLERVEVLRGPQGTLYGAGSMAGTIRYIAAKPDPSEYSGSAETTGSVTKGGDPSFSVRGVANVPLVKDKLAMRIGAYHAREGGYIDDIGRDIENVNDTESTQARIAVRALPAEGLTLDASVFYMESDTDGRNSVYREIGNRTSSMTPEGFDESLKVFNFTGEYDFGGATLLSSTSYADREFNIDYNLEALLGAFFGLGPLSPSYIHQEVENFTQEVRLFSTEGRLSWQLGAFYGHDERFYSQDAFYVGLDALLGVSSPDFYGTPAADEVFYGTIDTLDEQWAVFGELTYQFTDRLELTAGLRYFDFSGPATYYQAGVAGADVDGSPLVATATEKADGLNPRFVARYKVSDDFMVFAEAARGFRFGGVNYPVPISFCGADLAADGLDSAPLTFGPDNVWTYTVGEKASLADNRVTLNASAFYIEWNDTQTIHPLACAFPFIENSGSLTSKGVEVETLITPTEGLAFGLSLSYTDVSASAPLENIGVEEGDRAPYSPKWTVGVSGDYRVPLGAGELEFSADYSYRGEAATEFNMAEPLYRKIPSSSLLNAAITFSMDDWEFGVFARNLLDDELVSVVRAAAYPTNIGDEYAIGRQRTFGVRAATSF